jgi:PEP-CTERM motif
VINATNRGWYINSGSHNYPFSSTENYVVGSDQKDPYLIEYRNFFFFDLAGVSQPIASAKLVLSAGHYDSGATTENYELHDVTTPIDVVLRPPNGGISVPNFDDFGTGVVYGSRTMGWPDFGTVVEIELNGAAISALNATHGPFGIGGSLPTLNSSLPNGEIVFGSTGSSKSISQLRITYVPEPSTLMLLAIGAISLLGYREAKS